MTPDEAIKKLAELNIIITRRTLLNYETWGLIPSPNRIGKGRGRGRYTDYPEIAWIYAYVAYRLMHDKLNIRPELVSILKADFDNKVESGGIEIVLLRKWFLLYWEAALEGIPIGEE